MYWYPEIETYLKTHLPPNVLIPRKTVTDPTYIVPALNTKIQNTIVKYIFGIPKSGADLVLPWTRIPGTKWYVIDAATIWPVGKKSKLLTGMECVPGNYIKNNPVLSDCDRVLYFQYHIYVYHSLIGRNYKFSN